MNKSSKTNNPQPEATKKQWDKLVLIRAKEIDNGNIKLVPADEVYEKAMKLLN